MKYRAIGSNRATAARMMLEFEADSKAAAERKASASGMIVSRVEATGESEPDALTAARNSMRRGSGGGLSRGVRLVVFLGVVLALWWMYQHGWLPFIGRLRATRQ